MVKNPSANAGDTRNVGLIPGLGRSLVVENGNSLRLFLLGKFNEQRHLVGYSPQGCKELDMAEHTNTHHLFQ